MDLANAKVITYIYKFCYWQCVFIKLQCDKTERGDLRIGGGGMWI